MEKDTIKDQEPPSQVKVGATHSCYGQFCPKYYSSKFANYSRGSEETKVFYIDPFHTLRRSDKENSHNTAICV